MAQQKTAAKTSGNRRSSTKRTSRPATAAARTTKAAAPKRAAAAPKRRGDEEVTIDRRRKSEQRNAPESVAEKQAAPATPLERRKKVNRRRQIDPTTCERDYTDDEVQFMNALDDYKRKSGRMFPTCSEVLEVLRSLGYGKLTPAELATHESSAPSAHNGPMSSDDWDHHANDEFDAGSQTPEETLSEIES